MNELFDEKEKDKMSKEKSSGRRNMTAEMNAILAGALVVGVVMVLQHDPWSEQATYEVQEEEQVVEFPTTFEEQGELTQLSITYSNLALGVFHLEGDGMNIRLIGPDGSVIKSGPNDFSNLGVYARIDTECMSERGVYIAHTGYILNTVTGEYYEEANPYFHSVKIEGVEASVISFLKSSEGTTSLFVQTDDMLYSLVLDEKMRAIFESIVSEEETPIGEITIANDTLLIVAY